MASEYAVCLGKRDSDHPVSHQWYEHFMKRWPEIKLVLARGLEIQRTKATSAESVTKYYSELDKILTKYHLRDKPERIYNVDEKGLSTSHKPPRVVAGIGNKPPAVTSGSRITVTVIGCGNALGNQVPPFFIFPGTRMRDELMTGKTPGAQGTVSESGWSNGDIFRRYLEDHLIRYLPERSENNQVLILYDGHRSHVNLGLIEWARQQHIILFVLPAHTSHVLQLLDIGCFGPFERIFNAACHRYMRDHCEEVITKYNICALGCSSYSRALSTDNLQSSFRRAGIFPFNTEAVDASHFKPAEVQQQVEVEGSQQPATVKPSSSHSVQPCEFFNSKQQPIVSKKRSTKKKRLVSSIVSGMAITEEAVVEKIQDHQIAMSKPPKKKKTAPTAPTSPVPGPSGIKPRTQPDAAQILSSESESENESDEKCCICQKFTPEEVQRSTSLIFVKWVKCDNHNCSHWTHLKYCTKVTVVRRGSKFLCAHCDSEE